MIADLVKRLWPRSLANRTALVLLAGLAMVQAGGLLIYMLDRMDLVHLAQAQEFGQQIDNAYRAVVTAAPEDRQAVVRGLEPPAGLAVTLDPTPASSDLDPAPPPVQRVLRISLQFSRIPSDERWTNVIIRGTPYQGRLLVSLHLPTGEWLNVRKAINRSLPFLSETFLVPFMLMTLAAAGLVMWAVRQFSAPMRDLAAAAEQLGLDVNAPPLSETGTVEAAKAAKAFNVMADRIRRFVRDRTFLLTAIGHDLRTPITRLKLRAEWMEDEEQQRKMLLDLDELEGMVAATLAFGRDDAAAERLTSLDLAELLRTILDEAADARPSLAEPVRYDGPPHQVTRARPVAIKRALSNLVQNALNYANSARVTLSPPQAGALTILIDDDGPGIPQAELERVFEPFHRLEPSRNRETGGTGLGLPIARNILRAHGGDVTLSNRPMGGLRATVTLPG